MSTAKIVQPYCAESRWILCVRRRGSNGFCLKVRKIFRAACCCSADNLLQDYAVLLGAAEVDQSIPVADRLLGRYGAGSVASLSFDKGFTRTADRELLSLHVPEVVMPKRGKKNAATRWRWRPEAARRASPQPSPIGAVSAAPKIFGKVGVAERKISCITTISPTLVHPHSQKHPFPARD